MNKNETPICRCCLQEKGKMKNMLKEIFQPTNHKDTKTTLFEGYAICSGIELRSQDKTHKTICRKCEKNLKVSFEFRKLCRDSNDTLLKTVLDEVKTEENIVYSETRSKTQVYRHSVFVAEATENDDIDAIPEIKIEETASNASAGEEIEEIPERIDVKVILKEEHLASPQSDIVSDDDQGMRMDVDDDSYDDIDNIKDSTDKRNPPSSEEMDTHLLEGSYACLLCELTLNNFRDLKSHRQTHLWDTAVSDVKRQICGLCNKHTDGYLNHIRYEHPEYKPNSCRQCDLTFNHASKLHLHLQTHLKGNQFACKGCSEKFPSSRALKVHISRTKHTLDLYECNICGLGFPLFTTFYEHFKQLHYEDTINRPFYPCFACKNIFFRPEQGRTHNCDPNYSMHVAKLNEKKFMKFQRREPTKSKKTKKKVKLEDGENEKSHECDRCSERFVTEDEMVCHQHSLCDGVKHHICTICDKDFKQRKKLAAHQRAMHGAKKVICDVCGSTWTSEAKLKTHKIMVHGERSFQCHCGGAFKSATALKSHQRVKHSGFVFECYHCPKKFQSIGGIRRHIPRHISTTEAAFKCDFCEKTFRIMVDKRDHERGHKGKMFPCHLCANVYTKARLLQHHIEYNHQGLTYVCTICQQTISHKSQLNKHFFLHRGFKPFQCKICTHQELTKDRFKKHLKKQHNIVYVEETHGYVEKDPNIRKLIEEVFQISTKKPDQEDAASRKRNKRQPKKAAPSQEGVQFGDDAGNSFVNNSLQSAQQVYQGGYVNY